MLAAPGWSPDLQPALTRLLRCPTCASNIKIEQGQAVCTADRHAFPIVDGVIVMVDDQTLRGDPQYEKQRRFFDEEFSAYDVYRLENWRRSYLARLRSAGALGGPLVDVGVGGSGYTVIESARAGALAVGCDLSLAGLVNARKLAVGEGVDERTLWVCCSAEKLPLESSAFASALAIAVIEHVPDDTAVLREMARVLQPGGRAWVTVPHALRNISPVFRAANRRHDRRLGHLRRYEAETLVEAGGNLGLVAGDVQFTGHPVKVLQLTATKASRGGSSGDRLWWWCESRDLARSRVRRGSMQLSVSFTRAD
jgi:ubiquinone/menaquinone biosynthesis C-methylase UbiE